MTKKTHKVLFSLTFFVFKAALQISTAGQKIDNSNFDKIMLDYVVQMHDLKDLKK